MRRLGAGGFQLREDVVADGERVADGFHGVGVLLDFTVAEVVGLRAEGDDEDVVFEAAALFEEDALRLGIHAGDGAFAEAGARLAVEQFTEGVADVRRRHEARRNLVDERREEVVIVLVDQGDAVIRVVAEVAGEVHTGESTAEDDEFFHVMSL